MRLPASAVAVLALAACGGASDSSELERAAEATSAETSRFEMRYSSEQGEFRAEMSGLFDYANDTGVINTFDVEEPEAEPLSAEPLPEEIRFLDDTVYVAWKVEGGTRWVEEPDESASDPLELFMPLPGNSSDPADIFSLLLRSSGSIVNLGVAEIRGSETTHYRAEVDLAKLVEQLPAEERAEVDRAILDDRVPVEVWVDPESRVRRVTLREEMDTNVFMTTSFDFFDFGVDVDVEAPPKGTLISQERLDELQGNEGWTEYGEQCADLRGGAPPEETERACAEIELSE